MVAPALPTNAVRVNPGFLYIANLGSTEPTGLTGAWPSAWVPIGLTDGGNTDTYNLATANIDAAELLDPVRVVTTGRTMTVAFSALNVTAQKLQMALNAGVSVPTVSGGYTTITPPSLGSEVRVMLGWDAVDGLERKVWRRAINTGSVALARAKAPAKAVIPFSFTIEPPLDGVTAPFAHYFDSTLNV